MTTNHPDETAFERSRQHRRGVRQACLDLEEALARPVRQDPDRWFSGVAIRVEHLATAFHHHVEQSESPDGLLSQIVDVAPRLVHAVGQAKVDHQVLAGELAGLQGAVSRANVEDVDQTDTVRHAALHLLLGIAAHRQRGADLIYDAYSVDVEAAD
jgi:hypothetical protein